MPNFINICPTILELFMRKDGRNDKFVILFAHKRQRTQQRQTSTSLGKLELIVNVGRSNDLEKQLRHIPFDSSAQYFNH
jgi:hypothetical protein